MIKVIVGQRRIGKSYLLFQLMDDIRKEIPDADIIYINKELFEFDQIKTYADLIDYVELPEKIWEGNAIFSLMRYRISKASRKL